MKAGETKAIEYVSFDRNVAYKSSNPEKVYVDSDGVIHARKAGKNIKLCAKINGKTVTIMVTVSEAG